MEKIILGSLSESIHLFYKNIEVGRLIPESKN